MNDLVVSELCYAYAEVPVIRNLSFTVCSGELLTICGSNGCGKSTLLRLIGGLIEADGGEVQWPQQGEFHNVIGYLGHKDGLNPSLTPYQHFSTELSFKLQFTQEQAAWLLGQWGLSSSLLHRPVAKLSAGQRKRVAFAILQAKYAKVWLLDEPFFNLDLDGQSILLEKLHEHLAQGGVVLVTQHQSPESGEHILLSEVEYVASVS